MVLRDVVWLFEEANLARFGIDLFTGSKAILPRGPGPFCTLVESGGQPPDGTHNMVDRPAYVQPSVQVMWRGDDYDATRDRAQASFEVLYRTRNQFVNATWWVRVLMKQQPFDLGPDDVGRPRIVFNIDVLKRMSPETSR